MKGKMKTQYVGLLLILVMFFSTFAFAIINSIAPPEQAQSSPTPQEEIQRHLKTSLSEQQKSSLAQNGFAIIEFIHTPNCANCTQYSSVLESFYRKYENVLWLDIEGEQDSIKFIGKETKQLTDITDAKLLDAYCEVSRIQPKECILKNI